MMLYHGTFTLRRVWKAAPEVVFNAWADPALKARWFKGPDDWDERERRVDFREGGEDVLEARFANGRPSRFVARYHAIEAPSRLVYVYDLWSDGAHTSVTLGSLSLLPEGAGTRVAYTEQIVFLDGQDGTAGREHGTALQYDAIEQVFGWERLA